MTDHLVFIMARCFGLRGVRCQQIGGGFSDASVWCLENADGNKYAIRRTPESVSLPPDRLQALHHLLKRIAESGIDCISVPLTPAGASFSLADPSSSTASESPFLLHSEGSTWIRRDDDVWQAEPWMPGSPVTRPSESQLVSTFANLIRFHQAASRCVEDGAHQMFCNRQDYSPGIARRLKITSDLSDVEMLHFRRSCAQHPDHEFRQLALRALEAIGRWLPELQRMLTSVSQSRYRLQPVIRDLWKAHVLFREDRVTGLIDLTAMATDHPALDLTRLLRSWYGADTRSVHRALQMYVGMNDMQAADWKLFRALDASTVLLSPVTWLRRRLLQPQDFRTPEPVIQRIAELTSAAELFEPL